MNNLAIATVIAPDFLAYARVLGNSIRQYHPDIPFFALLVDPQGESAAPDEPFSRISLEEINRPEATSLLFKYDMKQVLTALKPALLLHLLDRGFASVLHLDADMLLLDRIDDIFSVIQSRPLTLTPHLQTLPGTPARSALEHQLLLTGIYNGGFIGASSTPQTLAFLTWWNDRLRDYCVDDIHAGFHFDQRWLDLAPSYVEDCTILRDPGINTGYWLLSEIDSGENPDRPAVNGTPCRLFHFSGFDPEKPRQLTRYYPETEALGAEGLRKLYSDYFIQLNEAGLAETANTPWAWDHFSNGRKITAEHRFCYQKLIHHHLARGNPFNQWGLLALLNALRSCRRALLQHLEKFQQSPRLKTPANPSRG
jgi:hypothetical protein